MSYLSNAKNNPFNDNYISALAPYVFEMTAPTTAPAPADVSQKVYSGSGDTHTAFLLLIATPGVAANIDPSRIFKIRFTFDVYSCNI